MFEFIEPDYKMRCSELVRWIVNNNYNYYLEMFMKETEQNIYRMDEEALYNCVLNIIFDEVYNEDTYNDWKVEE